MIMRRDCCVIESFYSISVEEWEWVTFVSAAPGNNNVLSKLVLSPNEIKGLIAKEAWPTYPEYTT